MGRTNLKLLENMLDVGSVNIIEHDKLVPIESTEPEDADYEFVRGNYYDIIQQGTMALQGALRVASESENPRAYEVVGGLLRQMADINRQLLQVGKDKQEVKQARKGVGGGQPTPTSLTQNNTVFVGNSSDLAKMLKEINK